MKLGYVILYVGDVGATIAFYEAAFGLERRFVHDSGQYAELETGATALAFVDEAFVTQTCPSFRRNRCDEEPAGAEIGLVVDDVQAAFDKAVKAGAQAYLAPLRKPWGQTVSYVRDCNGFLIELCSKIGG